MVTEELAEKIQNAGVAAVYVQTEERVEKVLSNMMVELTSFVDVEPETLGITEKYVYYPVLRQILDENDDIEDIKDAIKKNAADLVPMHITKEDIFASINYNMHLEYGVGNADDIDHLGNRRIRAVGEPVSYTHLRPAMAMEKPLPSLPRSCVRGTQQSLKINSDTAAERMPILSSVLPTENPGVSLSTIMAERPFVFREGSVSAIRIT